MKTFKEYIQESYIGKDIINVYNSELMLNAIEIAKDVDLTSYASETIPGQILVSLGNGNKVSEYLTNAGIDNKVTYG